MLVKNTGTTEIATRHNHLDNNETDEKDKATRNHSLAEKYL